MCRLLINRSVIFHCNRLGVGTVMSSLLLMHVGYNGHSMVYIDDAVLQTDDHI